MCVSVVDCVLAYAKTSSELPENIIIFRDGVGDGQIAEVLRTEVSDIQKAIKKVTSFVARKTGNW